MRARPSSCCRCRPICIAHSCRPGSADRRAGAGSHGSGRRLAGRAHHRRLHAGGLHGGARVRLPGLHDAGGSGGREREHVGAAWPEIAGPDLTPRADGELLSYGPARVSATLSTLMILIAGPYRSVQATPRKARGQRPRHGSVRPAALSRGAPARRGRVVGLAVVALAGSRSVGDAAFVEVFHPIAERLLDRCDAVLRVGERRRART